MDTNRSRRQFLTEASLVVSSFLGLADLEQVLKMAAPLKLDCSGGAPPRHLLAIHLEGGNDCFNTILPLEQGIYQDFRRGLAPEPQRAFALAQGLYLNRELATFAHLYEAGKLAIVQGLGYANPSFSHYLAQDIWHSGRLDRLAAESWTGLPTLVLSVCFPSEPGPEKRTPESEKFFLLTPDGKRLSLEEVLRKLAVSPIPLHLLLQIDGFDNHVNLRGNHQKALKKLDCLLAQLLQALEENPVAKQNTLFLVYSEFGRRLALNGESGTEHGGGAFAYLFGEAVRGGLWGPELKLSRQVDAQGLYRSQLDFRVLYATVLSTWLKRDPVKSLGRNFETLALLKSATAS